MAQTQITKAPATVHCVVLRAMCIAGERQEVGATVELTAAQYSDCFTAGKVGPVVAKPAPKPASKSAKAAQE